MITEGFLNLCARMLSDPNILFNDNIVSDIHDILKFYSDKIDKIPLPYQSKYNFVYSLSKLRYEGKDYEIALDDLHLTVGDDLKTFHGGLSRPDTNIPEDKVNVSINQIKSRKKLVVLLKDLPQIETYIDKFQTNSFDNLDDAIKEYDNIVSKMYSRISEQKRYESYNTIRSLDLSDDRYDAVLNQIELSYSGKNAVTTGYKELDKYMNKGFEPSRLYVFGGSSGDGKSVLLLNFVKNAVSRYKGDELKKDIYIYITLENLIDETLMRLYCSLKDVTIGNVVKDYESQKYLIEDFIKQWQRDNNSILTMAYFPPTITSVSDLLVYIDDIAKKYEGVGNIKGVYIDYLDLLKSGQVFDLHRLEMGQVTIDLKVAAVKLSIPIITATQLNRQGYDHKENLSLTQMGESIKKVEHSDFVSLIRAIKNGDDDNSIIKTDFGEMSIFIGKNRSGPKEKIIKLKTNFSHFRVDDKEIHDQFEFTTDRQDMDFSGLML